MLWVFFAWVAEVNNYLPQLRNIQLKHGKVISSNVTLPRKNSVCGQPNTPPLWEKQAGFTSSKRSSDHLMVRQLDIVSKRKTTTSGQKKKIISSLLALQGKERVKSWYATRKNAIYNLTTWLRWDQVRHRQGRRQRKDGGGLFLKVKLIPTSIFPNFMIPFYFFYLFWKFSCCCSCCFLLSYLGNLKLADT